MELGGGVGLSSLAAALYSSTVICTGKMWVGLYVTCISCNSTDTGDGILELCSKNIQWNIDSLGREVIPGEVGVAQ